MRMISEHEIDRLEAIQEEMECLSSSMIVLHTSFDDEDRSTPSRETALSALYGMFRHLERLSKDLSEVLHLTMKNEDLGDIVES